MRLATAAAAVISLLATFAPRARAQAAWQQGAIEMGVLSAGGTAIVGGLRDRGVTFTALRWGRQMTGELGRSPLRGNLQYSVETIPLYLQFQSKVVYGAGLTPFLLRYNFTKPRSWSPYVEIGAGILGTTQKVPEDTSRFNFTPQGGVGVQFIMSGKRSFTAGVRYHHTSNAGLARSNPGINAILFHTGVSWWH